MEGFRISKKYLIGTVMWAKTLFSWRIHDWVVHKPVRFLLTSSWVVFKILFCSRIHCWQFDLGTPNAPVQRLCWFIRFVRSFLYRCELGFFQCFDLLLLVVFFSFPLRKWTLFQTNTRKSQATILSNHFTRISVSSVKFASMIPSYTSLKYWKRFLFDKLSSSYITSVNYRA